MSERVDPPRIDHLIYGPVSSRRFGRSLGVNIIPQGIKVCTFNCVYCQFGWTRAVAAPIDRWPTARAVAEALEAALEHLRAPLSRITLAGGGEPTLHPHLTEIVDAILRTRDVYAAGVPVVVLTNGTRLLDPTVREAVRRLQECHVKLDAGTSETLRRVNGTAVPLSVLLEGLAHVPEAIVQSLFVHDPQGRCGNDDPAARASWLDTLRQLRPRQVHLYSLARRPALARLEPVSGAWLDALARDLVASGIPATVFN
ncbi:MAG: radical SAM protein [Vicinamibacterales bacterium]